jgi:hypothetical protein
VRLEAQRAGQDRLGLRAVACVEQREEGAQRCDRAVARTPPRRVPPGGDVRLLEQGGAEVVARLGLDAVGEDAQDERRVDDEQRRAGMHPRDARIAAEVDAGAAFGEAPPGRVDLLAGGEPPLDGAAERRTGARIGHGHEPALGGSLRVSRRSRRCA